MKKNKIPKYKKQQKMLKKIGVINHKITKKPSSKREQAEVRRKWDKYSEAARNKEKFVTRHVGKENAKLFKSLGYMTKGQKVWINKEGANSIHIKKKSVKGKKITIISKISAEKELIDYVIPKSDIHENLEMFENQKLLAGEFVTLKIGDNSQFRRRFKSMKALNDYLNNIFTPQQPLNKKYKRSKKDQEKLRQELVDQMSIVKFSI